jgi:hypothetical protein
MVCAPCMLPLLAGAGAMGSGGAASSYTSKKQLMLYLLTFILSVMALLFWRLKNQCDTCQLTL